MKFTLSKISKKILENKDYKVIVENIFSLSGLQIAGYILPLITLPYLVRVLGPEKYGLIAFATAFVTYFQLLTNYGFNLSATREISIHRNNKDKISEIFSSVIIIKSLLMIVSLILLIIVVFTFSQFKNDWLIYLLTFGMVVGNVLFPIWFFQGIEKMKYITILNVLAQVIFTISIFIFIKSPNDYIFVPLINSLGILIAGIWGFKIALKSYDINLILPPIFIIKSHFKEGWHVFLSTAAISLYTTSNTFILGVFTNTVIVSYYAVAEKIILAVIGLLNPISQAIYPHISKVVINSKEKGIVFIRKITKIIGILGLVLSLLLFIFAGLIINILFGSQFSESITVLRILSFLPLIVGLSNVFGIQTMLTFNYKEAFSRIILGAGLINISLALILVPQFKDIGISVSFLFAEIFITITMFLYLRHKEIHILGAK